MTRYSWRPLGICARRRSSSVIFSVACEEAALAGGPCALAVLPASRSAEPGVSCSGCTFSLETSRSTPVRVPSLLGAAVVLDDICEGPGYKVRYLVEGPKRAEIVQRMKQGEENGIVESSSLLPEIYLPSFKGPSGTVIVLDSLGVWLTFPLRSVPDLHVPSCPRRYDQKILSSAAEAVASPGVGRLWHEVSLALVPPTTPRRLRSVVYTFTSIKLGLMRMHVGIAIG